MLKANSSKNSETESFQDNKTSYKAEGEQIIDNEASAAEAEAAESNESAANETESAEKDSTAKSTVAVATTAHDDKDKAKDKSEGARKQK